MSQDMTRTVYFCIGPFCWGKGATATEAKRQARRNLPGPPYVKDRKRVVWHVYQLSGAHVDQAYVGDMGELRRHKDDSLRKIEG